ncbi:hypothetical protein QBC32DRAFT_261847 [Pseudoneurospora amorphoporcata]|uniref:Uncharacterized protein n=1 Tax=Pseudoneurospora amorphoporcata TaxID=241081 RepID=A0AAN6SFI7_9PEZI|nr:hypothetical protein QBC32DRAFT_261847 [Pseudoneurospora amorphoporcata]
MSSSRATFYAHQTMNLYARYGLSDNAKRLLRDHDQWRMGSLDRDQLGRNVRMSPDLRKSITDTITKCAAMMRKKPDEVKNCIEIIQACTEILDAADKPPDLEGFPFLTLPAELRQIVYGWYATKIVASTLVAYQSDNCDCGKWTSPNTSATPTIYRVDMALARTCRQIKTEYLEFVYHKYTLYFDCCCELNKRLKINPALRSSLRSIKVHWNGPVSDKAFTRLAKCQELKHLDIVVSKSTTCFETPREKEMRRYFRSLKPARLVDALGIDELLTIRGLTSVCVSHVNAKQNVKRTDEERANLQGLLRVKLLVSGLD